MQFNYAYCKSCQLKSCINCVQNENFKYVVRCTNISKYWSLFNLIIGASPLDGNGYFTIILAKDIIETEKLDDILPREFWETMSYFLSRRNHKLFLDRKNNAKSSSKNKYR